MVNVRETEERMFKWLDHYAEDPHAAVFDDFFEGDLWVQMYNEEPSLSLEDCERIVTQWCARRFGEAAQRFREGQ